MYKDIKINNLKIIQSECMAIMSSLIDVSHNQFMWPKDQSIMKVESLRHELERIGILEYVFGPAFSVTYNKSSDIHIDHAYSGWRYSLNIPIKETDNTFLTFYDCDSEKTSVAIRPDDTGNKTYTKFELSDCKVLARYETNVPAIIDTTVPHKFESFNDNPRVMLLLRLNKEFNKDIIDNI